MTRPRVLTYEEAAIDGLQVDRSAGHLTIILPPSDLCARAKDGLEMTAPPFLVHGAVVGAVIVVAWLVGGVSPQFLIGIAVVTVACLALLYPVLIALGGVYNQTVRVEVLPEVLRLTAIGRGMNLVSAWPRSDIASVHVGMHGIRVRLRNSRRGGWIAFGNRKQQRRMCQLIRDELDLPPPDA